MQVRGLVRLVAKKPIHNQAEGLKNLKVDKEMAESKQSHVLTQIGE